jgi:hypothetical protein
VVNSHRSISLTDPRFPIPDSRFSIFGSVGWLVTQVPSKDMREQREIAQREIAQRENFIPPSQKN